MLFKLCYAIEAHSTTEDPENTEKLQFKRRRWSADSIRLLVPHLLSGEAYNLLEKLGKAPETVFERVDYP